MLRKVLSICVVFMFFASYQAPETIVAYPDLPCPQQGGELCSHFRVFCAGYTCHDSGAICTEGQWPQIVTFGNHGTYYVWCKDGAIVIG